MTTDSAHYPPISVPGRHSSSLVDRAYSGIRDAIAGLQLQPGQALTEASLSEWLGIGRMPVREALLRLRDEGLVESVPRKGYYVSRLSADEAQEIYETLEGLESVAAKLAAERATPVDLERLEVAVRRLEDALERDDLDAWAAADDAVHETILDIARNRQLQRMAQSLQVRVKRLQLFTIRMRPKPVVSTRTHRAQLDAIKAGDGKLARELRQELWVRARAEMVNIVRRYASPSGMV